MSSASYPGRISGGSPEYLLLQSRDEDCCKQEKVRNGCPIWLQNGVFGGAHRWKVSRSAHHPGRLSHSGRRGRDDCVLIATLGFEAAITRFFLLFRLCVLACWLVPINGWIWL